MSTIGTRKSPNRTKQRIGKEWPKQIGNRTGKCTSEWNDAIENTAQPHRRHEIVDLGVVFITFFRWQIFARKSFALKGLCSVGFLYCFQLFAVDSNGLHEPKCIFDLWSKRPTSVRPKIKWLIWNRKWNTHAVINRHILSGRHKQPTNPAHAHAQFN